MPRVTTNQQLDRHQLLRLLWLEAPVIFSILTPQEQWDLHELSRPNEQLTEAELAEHLAGLRKTKPSLANKVGKTYRVIERVHQTLLEYDVPLSNHLAVSAAIRPLDPRRRMHAVRKPDIPRKSGQKARYISVAPIMKPEIDVHQLSRAFIALMRHQQEEKVGDSASDLPSRSEDDPRAA
ncbi:MAG: hypothetical protein ABIR17_09460 [Pseudolysinimonas sp.]|uniref:hypothetical protein n=1 Tax=Pseudolysinimonas sp. TaxID=2680009 RepID=UPI003263A62E